ncbi:MAG: hypothetical protein JWN14_935 [Chthonomonadales bacterium]|nr:hypothetical protein [Chthonomonadales bacterium]
MNGSATEGIQLAPGFAFTDHLPSAYRLAYGHVKSTCGSISISRLDGSPNLEVLQEDRQRLGMTVCFSPDGSTMYRFDGRMYAHDLDTGMVRLVEGIPPESSFEEVSLLEVSPDNRFVLFIQTATPQWVRGGAAPSPCRLCRLNADGTGFRVLYEDPAECHLDKVVCNWSQGFLLLHRSSQISDKERDAIWKLDLATNTMTLAGKISEIGWDLAVQLEGNLICWSTFNEGIYLGTLEENGITGKCVTEGSCPAWSPDGKTLAFMNDQHCLTLWDVEREQARKLVWFEPSGLDRVQRRGTSYAVEPVWSPDGQMLWFALTQTRKLRRPKSLSERIRYAYDRVYPLLHNLNPRRTSIYTSYRHQGETFRIGIVDLKTKQVKMRNGFGYGVDWLPDRSESKVTVTV